MNLIFETNYAIFSIFAALLITEIIGSVVLLLFYDAAKSKVLEYVVPIWEVTGTFAAFWVVTGDMAYPTLLIPVATIFGGLLTIFLITLVARNATIVFGEFIIKRKWLDAKKLYKGYALSTILLGVSVLILLSSLISGAGIVGLTSSFSLTNWLTSGKIPGGSLLFIVGTLLIGVGLAPVFFDIKPFRTKYFPLTLLGVLVSIGAYYFYLPSLLTWWLVVPALLTIVAGLLFISDKTAPIVANKAIFISVLSVIVFSLQPLIYPKFAGQTLPIDALTTSGAMVTPFYEISLVGAALLAIMLGVYVWVVMRQKGHTVQPKARVERPAAPTPVVAPSVSRQIKPQDTPSSNEAVATRNKP